MTEADLKQLIESQTNGGGINPLSQILEPLMPLLSFLFVVSIVLSIVIVVYFIINIVQRQRQHYAIMRIDRNLQKLVDIQTGDTIITSNKE